MKVLIISNKIDAHADAVLPRLVDLGAEVFRFNTEDFPRTIRGCYSFGISGEAAVSVLEGPKHRVDLDGVHSFWHRRPADHVIDPSVKDDKYREFAARESEAFVDGLWAAYSDRKWVNAPDRNAAAGHKLGQMRWARSLGFLMPDTIVTNDAATAREFVARHSDVIVKGLSAPLVVRGDRAEYAYTRRLSVADLEGIESVKLSPVILQVMIEKDCDVRVTVIGRQVFAVAISSQDREDSKIDFRRAEVTDLSHQRVKLPDLLESMCLKLTRGFGLRYSAIDLVLGKDGKWYFLEVNPNGQFGWMDRLAGVPLFDAMARYLISED